jgi:hypothetical protein
MQMEKTTPTNQTNTLLDTEQLKNLGSKVSGFFSSFTDKKK